MNDKTEDPKQPGTEVAAQTLGTDLAVYDPGAYAGAGMENISREEYAIPFLYVLDAKSPQCAPVKAGGVEGAKAGSLYNTATNEMFDGEKGVSFIPVDRKHDFGEWIRRNEDGSGGGFVGIRAPDDPLVLELRKKYGQFGKLVTDDNHELVETFYLSGLTVVDGVGSAMIFPFKSTGIAAYKNFMTRVMNIQYVAPNGAMIRPPMWAHRWRLGTQYKTKGTMGWYIPRLWLEEEPPIKSRLKLTDPLYLQARELYDNIKAGRVVVKQDTEAPTDKDIPF